MERVERLIAVLEREMSRTELQEALRLGHRRHFVSAYLKPALSEGFIEMTLPDKPNSSKQRYRRTPAGEALARQVEDPGK